MIVGDGFHLTYCSNIHAGETWSDVFAALAASLPDIRRQLGATGPFAIGLRLSAQAATALTDPATLATFQAFLRDGDYYVLTINGFPYGAFHGQRVKEQVYLPDWRSPERVEYSNRLASLLAVFLADRADIRGSVSTVPGAFKTDATGPDNARRIAEGMLDHAAHLVRLRQQSGITITLAIEPEPACFIETVNDAIAFFRDWLFDESIIATAAQRNATPLSVADLRRHVGLCFDACHMAVEFEDPAAALDQLRDAGIAINKVQISSALHIDDASQGSAARAALRQFAEDTYLHQVVQRDQSGGLVRYVDLPEALSARSPDPAAAAQWRVHFHVPVFLAEMHHFSTTQPYLQTVLALMKEHASCRYLEVETYTWDVLPPEYRTTDMRTAIARELSWVRNQLTE